VGDRSFSAALSRFTFGRMELLSGIDFVVVAIGVFAASAEVLANMGSGARKPSSCPCPRALRNLLPTLQDLKDCRFAFVNGSVIGLFPRRGAAGAAARPSRPFLSYGLEKAVSPAPRAIRKRAS